MFVTRKKYEAALSDAQRERETASRILAAKIAESARVKQAEAQVRDLVATIDALRPDAEKYRAKLLRDRQRSAKAKETV